MRRTAANIGAVLLTAAVITAPVFAGEIPPTERRSGYSFMTPDTQAIQNDDTANPGMLGVLDGESLWKAKMGAANQACSDCHHDVEVSMRGVAARYPAFDAQIGRPVTLEQRINLCRANYQQATPLAYESQDLLALTTLVAKQSRGMPIEPSADPQLAPFILKGGDLFKHRQGQLNLACSNCHSDNWDKHLAGSVITQAQPTGYPMYRLEWQALGSLERRLRSCMVGVRAQPFDYGAPELVELELYLMSRAKGMPIETPAIRP